LLLFNNYSIEFTLNYYPEHPLLNHAIRYSFGRILLLLITEILKYKCNFNAYLIQR